MNESQAKDIIDKIIGQIFGYQNPLTLEQFQSKFTFDIRLPQQVYDTISNQPTWAQSTNPVKFVSFDHAGRNVGEAKTAYQQHSRHPKLLE